MPTAEARIQTERPSRYLVQLCEHVTRVYSHGRPGAHRRRHHSAEDVRSPGVPPRVEWSRTHGKIRSGWSTITMEAAPDALILCAEADDEEDLQRALDLLGDLLATFSRREHLAISWRRAAAPGSHDSPGVVPPSDPGVTGGGHDASLPGR